MPALRAAGRDPISKSGPPAEAERCVTIPYEEDQPTVLVRSGGPLSLRGVAWDKLGGLLKRLVGAIPLSPLKRALVRGLDKLPPPVVCWSSSFPLE